ncbi:MAG TPA: pilus assembly protein TadG-related protein [Polyangia bacterium]|nr:pilus assembly protein TadG-related protein [Polyangia bacterium]
MSPAIKISSVDRRQRGSVAIVMAASMTFLFALGALAVDAGFMYTRERSLQAVTDAAALAGGKGLSDGTSTAKATGMATKNGYTDGVAGNTVSVTSPAAKQIQVTISSAQAPIFGHIFGLGSKTMTATSIAAQAGSDPAIWAGGGCGASTGLALGGGPFTITGDLESNGPLSDYTGGGDTDIGSVTNSSLCPPPTPWRGPVGQPTGGLGQGPPTPDPWGYNIMSFPACSFGTDLTTPVGTYNVPDPLGVVAPGVYCANGNINLSSGSAILALGVTLLATGDIDIGSPAITNMIPYPGTNNLIAFSTAADSCVSGHPAINVGNSNVTLNGSLYAPAGCINMGGPDFTIDGSLVGNEVNVSGPDWTINAGGGGGGGAVTLYQ